MGYIYTCNGLQSTLNLQVTPPKLRTTSRPSGGSARPRLASAPKVGLHGNVTVNLHVGFLWGLGFGVPDFGYGVWDFGFGV